MMPRWNIATAIIAALSAYRTPVHFHNQLTPQHPSRSRLGRGNYGKNLRAHFDQVGINWSNKKRNRK